MRLALGCLLALAAVSATEAALPAPPFALDVSPARPAPGEPVDITLTPRGPDRAWDVYLMWAFSPEAAFLTPDGAWSPRPVAFRARLRGLGRPITARWRPTSGGDIPLTLVVVEPGGDPLARFSWTFRPEIVWIHGAARVAAPVDLAALAPLVALTLLACALVVMTGGAFRA
jgi:hypothetical protein